MRSRSEFRLQAAAMCKSSVSKFHRVNAELRTKKLPQKIGAWVIDG
jgi:hypothetical protein